MVDEATVLVDATERAPAASAGAATGPIAMTAAATNPRAPSRLPRVVKEFVLVCMFVCSARHGVPAARLQDGSGTRAAD